MFEKLRVHKALHGNIELKAKYHDEQLVRWAGVQKTNYRTGTLSESRKQRLDLLGFNWDVSLENANRVAAYTSTKNDERWQEQYLNLVEYRRQEGHCNVPFEYKEKSIGRWVSNQRETQAKNLLPSERKKLLDKIGFIWNVKEHNKQEAWMTMYSAAHAFFHGNRHLNVPSKGRQPRPPTKKAAGSRKKKVVSPDTTADLAADTTPPKDDDAGTKPLSLFRRLKPLILKVVGKGIVGSSQDRLRDCVKLLETSIEMHNQHPETPQGLDTKTKLLFLALKLDKALGVYSNDKGKDATCVYCAMYLEHLLQRGTGGCVTGCTVAAGDTFLTPSSPARKKRKME
ncbi:helicase [Seminavis robusta]|uniref:Helicase n=1 Tax=Seminavis robusta TaxID=568900 RepID=A0A9N8DRW2_9STRA|nr:helicase [Seminavis robusta]|eukprot:Sro307_g113450.1 helicase (341) ;mRNA; f:71073-72207